jgi:hypothetical protein
MCVKYQKNVVDTVKVSEKDMRFILGFSMFTVIMIYLGTLSLDIALMAGVVSFSLLVYLAKKGF